MISPLQLDALKELVNIGVGKAAASLNEMLDSPIELHVPSVSMITLPELQRDGDLGRGTFSCVQLGFSGSFTGVAALVFPPASAVKLVAALTGSDPAAPGLDGVMSGTLNEIGNIVINSVIGTLGNILESPFDFDLPDYVEGQLEDLLKVTSLTAPATILLIMTHFHAHDRRVEGNIFLVFEATSFDSLLTAIDRLCV